MKVRNSTYLLQDIIIHLFFLSLNTYAELYDIVTYHFLLKNNITLV